MPAGMVLLPGCSQRWPYMRCGYCGYGVVDVEKLLGTGFESRASRPLLARSIYILELSSMNSNAIEEAGLYTVFRDSIVSISS